MNGAAREKHRSRAVLTLPMQQLRRDLSVSLRSLYNLKYWLPAGVEQFRSVLSAHSAEPAGMSACTRLVPLGSGYD